MYICYIDESGTPELDVGIHYALVGIAIPAYRWRDCDKQINAIKSKYKLKNEEIHSAWMRRYYREQKKIIKYEQLTYEARRNAVELKLKESLRIEANKGAKQARAKLKEIKKIRPYIHLKHDERIACLEELCDLISGWGYCRIFGDVINKASFKGKPPKYPPAEEAFSQIVTRFERFLKSEDEIGLFIRDRLRKRFSIYAASFVDETDSTRSSKSFRSALGSMAS